MARSAFEAYQRQTASDGQKVVRRVLNETESIYVDFIRVLSMFIELAHQAKIDRRRRYDDPEAPFQGGWSGHKQGYTSSTGGQEPRTGNH